MIYHGEYDNFFPVDHVRDFDQMLTELDRIAKATAFNGIYGLNSASNSIKIHFGPGNSSVADYYRIQAQDVTASALGLKDR